MQLQTKNHLKDNRGDAHVSKMTIIAIAFVVGAILLVLTTSAFRGPINRWLSTVTNSWFADKNGAFEYSADGFDPFNNNPFASYEKNDNGTLKDVIYITEWEPGVYYRLKTDASALRTGNKDNQVQMYRCDAAGNIDYEYTTSYSNLWGIQVSDDGSSFTCDSGTLVWTAVPKP